MPTTAADHHAQIAALDEHTAALVAWLRSLLARRRHPDLSAISVRLPLVEMEPSDRPDDVDDHQWEECRVDETVAAVREVMEAKIDWIDAAWREAGGDGFALPAHVRGDFHWMDAPARPLTRHDQRLARMAPVDLSSMRDWRYQPELGAGRFRWIVTSRERLVPPAPTCADPDVDAFLGELGAAGHAIEDVVTRAS